MIVSTRREHGSPRSTPMRRDGRPALVLEVRLDRRPRARGRRRAMKYRNGALPAPGSCSPLGQEREEAGQEDAAARTHTRTASSPAGTRSRDPSQPAVSTAPVRYQVRYSASFQPPAAAIASQPGGDAEERMPIAQTSWNGCRRSRHWSSSATAMTSARAAVSGGRSATEHRISSESVCRMARPAPVGGRPGPARSGGDQLVVVAVEPVAQPVAEGARRGPGSGSAA